MIHAANIDIDDKGFLPQEHQLTEAIILAGGLGTRLRSAVPGLPKCMAPVNGKPFLYYILDYLLKQGISSFIFSLGYKHEVIEAFLVSPYSPLMAHHSPGSISYVIEEEPLGTGGAIKLACTKASQQNVLIVNGDTLFKVDMAKLFSLHTKAQADCTLALKPMKNFNRYGVVKLNEDGSVQSFKEKKPYVEGLINGGVYVLNTASFLREQLPPKFSFEQDYLEKFYPERNIHGLIQEGYFIDIGIPEDYIRAQEELTD